MGHVLSINQSGRWYYASFFPEGKGAAGENSFPERPKPGSLSELSGRPQGFASFLPLAPGELPAARLALEGKCFTITGKAMSVSGACPQGEKSLARGGGKGAVSPTLNCTGQNHPKQRTYPMSWLVFVIIAAVVFFLFARGGC
jgi:hypothetical protein